MRHRLLSHLLFALALALVLGGLLTLLALAATVGMPAHAREVTALGALAGLLVGIGAFALAGACDERATVAAMHARIEAADADAEFRAALRDWQQDATEDEFHAAAHQAYLLDA